MKNIFRNTGKPNKQSPSGGGTPRSPPPSSGLDSPGLLLRSSDLSTRIEPYTFGTSSPPPQTQSRSSNHHHQRSVYDPAVDNINGMPPPSSVSRRDSMRVQARPSSDDPWVVVDNRDAVAASAGGGQESRTSSLASVMQPMLGATGAVAPFIGTQYIGREQRGEPRDRDRDRDREGRESREQRDQRERDRERDRDRDQLQWDRERDRDQSTPNNAASHSPSPIPPPQSRTPQPRDMSKQQQQQQQRPPPSSTTPQPSLTQQQQLQQPSPHPGAQSPPMMNGIITQPFPDQLQQQLGQDPNAYPNGMVYGNGMGGGGGGYGNNPGQGREGSIHSQQDGKSWARGLFGATTGREKEANAELMRMIGFLTAAAPDDWNLVLEVCERASANESAAKEAARALRREFKYGEPSAQLSAARLWAIMLQNATDTFILQTASRKFLENLEDVINAESTSPVVRERLLDVLASAAYVYGKKPGKEGFAMTWRKVRPTWKPAEGVPFDPEDTLFESAFPRRAVGASPAVGMPPGQGIPISQTQTPPPVMNYGERDRRDDRGRRDRDRDRDRDKHLQQQRQYEATQYQQYRTGAAPPVPSRKDRGIIPPEEDMRRLLQECDVAKNNAQVLSQALPFATPATLGGDPVIQEFHAKCRASQELIVAQIPWASAGAERSRLAAAARRSEKNSGSDGAANGKLTKSKQQNGSADLTKEEKLLAALLTANQELIDVFRIYEELEKLAIDEMEEREVAKRSKAETKLDRTQIQFISPDGSLMMEPPASQGASSSRSASPAIPPLATNRTISNSSLPSAPSPMAVKVPGTRDLPHPPHPSNDHLAAPGTNSPSLPPSPAVYQHHSQQQPLSQLPPSPMQPLPPSQPMASPQVPPAQPYHAHHASNHSVAGAAAAGVYGGTTLNLPPAAPHGPRQPPSGGTGTANRSRTPSPDRNGNFTPSGTPPTQAHTHANMGTVPNPADFGPPSHPPPQFARSVANPVGARGVDAQKGRAEPPAGAPPPGLASVQNTGGMRIDMDAARRYDGEDDELMTPIKPSAKAMGKRKAEIEAPPDDEELERREEAELEEAFMRSTAPPEEGGDTPIRAVHYIYDAAAERARELDRLDREEQEQERLRRQQTRSSMQRIPGMGGSSGGSSIGAMNATKSLA